MDTTLSQSLPPDRQIDSLGGWRPDPNKVQVAITRGAGQYRALGRVIALTRLDEIKKRVDRAVDAHHGRRRRPAARPAHRHARPGSSHVPSPPSRWRSSSPRSPAGRVPARCWRSVTSSARRAAPGSTSRSASSSLPTCSTRSPRRPGAASGRTHWPRSASWSPAAGASTVATAGSPTAARASTRPVVWRRRRINRLGPRYPVLVGARNADVSYGSQNEIYRGMGRALSEWVTSIQLQDSMSAYFSGNRQATAVAITDRLGLKQRHHETPFSALGFRAALPGAGLVRPVRRRSTSRAPRPSGSTPLHLAARHCR